MDLVSKLLDPNVQHKDSKLSGLVIGRPPVLCMQRPASSMLHLAWPLPPHSLLASDHAACIVVAQWCGTRRAAGEFTNRWSVTLFCGLVNGPARVLLTLPNDI